MLRRPALVGLAIALVVPLAACTEATRLPEAEPSSEVAPFFASDEEALAAATEAYEEFLVISGEILRAGGLGAERLKPLVSEEVFASEAEGFETLVANGWKATGQSTLESSVLQQHTPGPAGQMEVVIYACVGVASTDIVDSSGNSQIDAGRQELLGFEVVFSALESGQLVIERKTLWDAEAACDA